MVTPQPVGAQREGGWRSGAARGSGIAESNHHNHTYRISSNAQVGAPIAVAL
jgi:hypothetical protein